MISLKETARRKKLAARIVEAIENDLSDRSGFDLSCLDNETRREIRSAWMAIITEEFSKEPPQ